MKDRKIDIVITIPDTKEEISYTTDKSGKRYNIKRKKKLKQ